MQYQHKKKKALGALLVVAFLFGGLTMLPADRVFAEQPKATLQLQGQGAMPIVNINKATAEELDAIRGIGPVLAERIVKYRDQNGAFKTVEDLSKVHGINGAKFQKIKAQVTV